MAQTQAVKCPTTSKVANSVQGKFFQLYLDLVSNANIPNVDDNKNEMFNEKFDSDLDEG